MPNQCLRIEKPTGHNPKKPSSQKCRNNEPKTLAKNQQARDQTGIDRLSDLPEHLIHKILLCLSPSDAINTQSLSRRWRDSIWPSCPILVFDEYFFGANYLQYYTEHNANRRRFTKFLLKSLKKQKESNSNYSNIDKFSIRMGVLHQSYPAVDGWVKYFIQNKKVKELDIRIKRVSGQRFMPYRLDECVFKFCPSLTVLYLNSCDVGLDCDLNANLPSVKRLTLSEMNINSNWLSRLIEGCPLLEDLCVELCRGLEAILVSAPNLKSLKLNLTGIEWVSVGSSRLESVEFSGNFTSYGPQYSKELGKVKEMKLKNLYMTEEWFKCLLKASPLIETLIIDGCTGLKRLLVISQNQKIKRFSMFRCGGIVVAVVLSSNLQSLEYSGDGMITFYCHNLRSAEVRISLDPIKLNATWFFRLKKLLEVFVKCKVLTLACQSDQTIIFPGALCERLPSLRELKHLKLEIRTLSTSCSTVVDFLIWLFPGLESLTIKSGSINVAYKVTKSQTRRTCSATMIEK